jgi:hypothetical protein
MASPDLASLAARSRRAYERAMLARAVRGVWPALLLAPVALFLHAPAQAPATIAWIAGLLAAALIALGWRGGPWRRGALPGVLSGLPVFLVPSLIAPRAEHCAQACSHGGAASTSCALACLGVALVAGVLLGRRAARDARPVEYTLAAAITGGLTASLTCSSAGGFAVVGAVAGLVAGSVPLVLLAKKSPA